MSTNLLPNRLSDRRSRLRYRLALHLRFILNTRRERETHSCFGSNGGIDGINGTNEDDDTDGTDGVETSSRISGAKIW